MFKYNYNSMSNGDLFQIYKAGSLFENQSW